ncbi:MAG TPA: hypothetical protein VNS63_16470 [Blastocatellia bacterium]|nr:hypothetical protein [Blastocatellia bacterium]
MKNARHNRRSAKVMIAIATIVLFESMSLATSARAIADVPFKGKAKGEIISLLPGPGGIAVVAVSEGTATHLGRFTREEDILLDPNTGSFTGDILFTAANGDQLVGIVAGAFTSPTDATGTYTFKSGTGRFENATGSADFVVSMPDGIHFTVKFAGVLDK